MAVYNHNVGSLVQAYLNRFVYMVVAQAGPPGGHVQWSVFNLRCLLCARGAGAGPAEGAARGAGQRQCGGGAAAEGRESAAPPPRPHHPRLHALRPGPCHLRRHHGQLRIHCTLIVDTLLSNHKCNDPTNVAAGFYSNCFILYIFISLF